MSNLLIHEKSPYLLQHAHNPVNWYPWGEESFRRAREEDKPLFLSIGYSTCHWCHVMERESFESEATAELLNRYFIAVKVDREERPDVDRIYMTFVQATTGSGGWPMSVFLTPDLKPFFGGTYFPPDNRSGRPGFRYILERIAEAWRTERDRIVESGAGVLEQLGRQFEVTPGFTAPDQSVLESGFYQFRRSFDPRHGGFGGAPKFPRPSVHNFLLRYHHRTGEREALDMVLATLQAMARGGMNDQLGGGFHRYAVDERWFVPHFEKMLYDQAQLAISYLEAFQITGDEFYAHVARKLLDYVLRDMTHPEGGFYSAEDADSAPDPANPTVKGEGAFYIWTRAEIDEVLSQPVAEWFCYHYGVVETGNVRDDPHSEFAGRNILSEAHSLEEMQDVRAALSDARARLLAHRSKTRARPQLDDKVLTAWNGLMISAFARAGQVLEDRRYLDTARRAADFILRNLYREGLLLRRYRDGEAAIHGFLDDYAFFVQALLDLYEAAFDPRDLELAAALAEAKIEQFEDHVHGGFFSTRAGEPSFVLRMKDDYDGAEPSGNSIAALNLLRLAQMTGRPDFRDSAERTLAAFGPRLAAAPIAAPQMLAALEFGRSRPKQIFLAGARDAEDTRALLRALNRHFLPNKVVLLVDSEESRRKLAAQLPVIDHVTAVGGAATAYVCENYTCKLPASDPVQFEQALAA